MGLLEYQSPGITDYAPDYRRRVACTLIAVCVIIAANVPLVLMAAQDHVWVSLNIALFCGPLANLIVLLVALAFIPKVRHVSCGASVWPYAVAIVLTCCAAVVADLFLIGTMDFHGC